jgi:4-amino-4-deoxy-L-arabinose transferase-like glycosyltransferase
MSYLYAGQQLAQGESFAFCHPYNNSIGPYFTLAGFNVRDQGNAACLYLNYPPGFPLILAASQILVGSRDAALYIPALFGVFGLMATFALGAVLFDPWVGALGALILAFTPTFLTFSTSPWSDVPGAVLLTGGIAAFLWGNQQKRKLWQIVGGGIGGGMIGWSIFIRYASVIVLLPLVVYVWLTRRNRAIGNRSIQVFSTCIASAILGVLIFNRVYYGGYLTTPYSPQHGWYSWPAFSLRYVFGESPVGGQSLLATMRTVWKNFAWLLLLTGWGVVRMRTLQRILVLGSVLLFAGFYVGYAFPPQGINARFLLPAFPFISLATGYGLWNAAPKQWRWWWRGFGTMVMGLLLLMPLSDHLRDLAGRNTSTASYVSDVVRLVEGSESNAVFLAYNANDAIAYYGQRTTLFYRRIPSPDPETSGYQVETFEDRLVAAVDTLLENGVPVYYVQDSDPPSWGILAILKHHFSPHPLGTAPPVYRIQRLSGDR